MNKERLDKLTGHTDQIVGLYLLLNEKYSLIDPTIFNKRVLKKYGGGDRARGFDLIRKSVYFGCLQDLANICFDKQGKTPSIRKIVKDLELPDVKKQLRERYAHYPLEINDNNPSIRVAIYKLKMKREKELAKEFDRKLKELFDKWNKFQAHPRYNQFESVRDRITAHFEIEKVGTNYGYVPIKRFGLRWSDLKDSIAVLRSIVEALSLLIRNAGMDMKPVLSKHNKYGKQFWE